MKKTISLILSLLLFLPAGIFAQVTDEGVACIQYQRQNYTYGDTHSVPYAVMSGSDLNDATSSYKYTNFSNYAVIFWPNGGYSAIDINSFHDSLPTYPIEGDDQSGRTYRLKSSSNGYCY